MNKFLNKNVRPALQQKDEILQPDPGQAFDFLSQCAACWNALDEARRKMRRSLMYSSGDQWGDYVR
ncbi:MAG: hypothetical protein IJE42_01795, partial [Bacteroidaceae bacterium]|nr:hypothetical protein [Bacteroidaceae bacterium]